MPQAIERDALGPGVPQLLVFLVQSIALAQELVAGRTRAVPVENRLLDALGMVLGGLPGAADLLGVGRDGAPGAAEDGRGIANHGDDG